MKKILIVLIIILSSSLILGQPTLEDDVKLFKRLIDYSEKKNITDSDIKACNRIADTLMAHNCYDYVIERNDTLFLINGLTFLFGRICEKTNTQYSIRSYMKYLIANEGSAEEQLAFSFEYIFMKNPEAVLNEIKKYKTEKQNLFLNHLVWGFINNRYYGPKDPYKEINDKAMIAFDNPPKKVLTKDNCSRIFFQVSPKLKEIYKRHKKSIDYIINESKKNL